MNIHFQVNSISKNFIALFLFFSSISYCAQSDTLEIIHTQQAPVIDGNYDDYCWQITEWMPIDELWIDWGTSITKNDFEGAYKVVWSKTENLLYFLVRTYDDILVDGYVPGITADNYNFDILEVFIDEDHSKGLHLFDDELTGENAENAFAYNIHSRFPSNGETTDSFRVQDIAGTGWDNRLDPVYNHHFDNFRLKLVDSIAFWEFSLKVYNDSYENSDPESSRVSLSDGKVMGLSLAYCDNDGAYEDPATRDNFIGSVWVPEEANNDHYKDAEYFGIAKLVNETSIPALLIDNYFESMNLFPNPVSNGTLNLLFSHNISKNEMLFCKIYSLDGKLVQSINIIVPENNLQQIDVSHFNSGMYIVHIENNNIKLQKYIQVLQ